MQIKPFLGLVATTALLCGATVNTAAAAPGVAAQQHTVDLVIALDVSGSMSGLIDSAKQRLWDIVNELGQAQPSPVLRVAILSFGKPAYDAESGYVRIDLPFTSDLDAVNQVLFDFDTDGGDEYVARAVRTAVDSLEWSTNHNGLRILFVAGNEGAMQDPLVSVEAATSLAAAKGIAVNTLYCGSDTDTDAEGWRRVATATNGLYASINQQTSTVANVATPMDAEILRLNAALNDTYVAFGARGQEYKDNQLAQDQNAGQMSEAAKASRTVTKAGSLYDATSWDLVDAVESGRQLEDVAESELPPNMQAMEPEEREEFVAEQSVRRQEIETEIARLDADRRGFIAAKRSAASPQETGLDEAIQSGLRTLAEQKGFSFE